MFEDSESEEEEAPAAPPPPQPNDKSRKRSADDDGGDAAPAPKVPVSKWPRGHAPPPSAGDFFESESDDDEASGAPRGRRAGAGWHREDWRDSALARAGAAGAASGSFLDKISRSFADPRAGASRAERPAAAADDVIVAARPPPAEGHWTAKSARVARERAVKLRSNPSGVDGRAAYDRPSMHNQEIVISVGPSSLPSSCRTTRSRIPPANAKWS